MVKLLRTDTTLDLSQKARVVRNRGCRQPAFIEMGEAHGPCGARDIGVYLPLFVRPRDVCLATQQWSKFGGQLCVEEQGLRRQ